MAYNVGEPGNETHITYHLQFHVHEFAWSKHWGVVGIRACLSVRPADWCARDDNGGGTAVVPNWEVEPGGGGGGQGGGAEIVRPADAACYYNITSLA